MTYQTTNWALFLMLLACILTWNAPETTKAASPTLQEKETEEQESEDDDDQDDDDQDDDEDDDERERITLKQVIDFTKKHMPDFSHHLRELLEEEGDDEELVEHILDQGREMIHGYYEIKETHGKRMGEKFLELFRVNHKIEMMYEEAEELGDGDLAKFKKQLKRLIAERYVLELSLEKAELHQLKAEVQDFEEAINRRVENREEIIEDQINEFLREVQGEEEEEEEEEHDDDDDGGDEGEEEDDGIEDRKKKVA